ncbi:MAG: hypothetical protein RJB39_696 [Candidatus Parcubacteria bacterium]|jgi:type 1 glutamine amidotransferase
MPNFYVENCYNSHVDPANKHFAPKAFLMRDGTREGRFANYLAILWVTKYGWVNQNVPFGFLI